MKKMMPLLASVVVLFLCQGVGAQDLITLRDGRSITGIVREIGDSTIRYSRGIRNNSEIREIGIDEVNNILFRDGRRWNAPRRISATQPEQASVIQPEQTNTTRPEQTSTTQFQPNHTIERENLRHIGDRRWFYTCLLRAERAVEKLSEKNPTFRYVIEQTESRTISGALLPFGKRDNPRTTFRIMIYEQI